MTIAHNDPRGLEQLLQQFKEPYFSSENYLVMNWFGTGLLRRMGLDPFKRPGDVLLWALLWILIYTFLILTPAVVVTAIAGHWATTPLTRWIVVSFLWGASGILPQFWSRRAIENVLALPGALASEKGFRSLIEWNRRWLRRWVFVLISTSFVAISIAVLLIIQGVFGGHLIHSSSLAAGVIVLYSIGEVYAVGVCLFAQTYWLASEDYRLYQPNPSQTLAVRRSLRGYNQCVCIGSIYMTVAILFFAILLPPNSRLIVPLTLSLLGMAYTGAVFGVVIPRLMINKIVRRSKQSDLAPLQRRVNELWSRVQQLGPTDYEELKRLKEAYTDLYNAPENLLNFGPLLASLARAVVLPTLTSVVTFLVKRVLVS